jgi:non-canonical poly(A) RNA polymerase PAPD5/7
MFQMMPHLQAGPPDAQSGNLGDLLMEFLDLYGNNFNTTTTGICLNPPGYFQKVSFPAANPSQGPSRVLTVRLQKYNPMNLPYRADNQDRLSIVDPNRPDNDISGGTKKIHLIRQLFSETFDVLRARMSELHHAKRSQRREQQSILAPVYGGSYKLFDDQRERLRQLHQKRHAYSR